MSEGGRPDEVTPWELRSLCQGKCRSGGLKCKHERGRWALAHQRF